MITVALDAMGGDYAPQAIVQGALRAAAADPDLSIALVGRSDEIRPLLPAPPPNIRLVEAPQVVTMAEQPAASVRQKPHSSIMVGLELVKHGEAQAFLSFGNTGAVMAAGLFTLGRIPGIDSPGPGRDVPEPAGLYDPLARCRRQRRLPPSLFDPIRAHGQGVLRARLAPAIR